MAQRGHRLVRVDGVMLLRLLVLAELVKALRAAGPGSDHHGKTIH